jgi:hypothetical protein
MFELEILYSRDNYKIVGYFTRYHVEPSLLLQAASDYDSDPEWIKENLCIADVIHQRWYVDTDYDGYDDGDDDGEKDMEAYCVCSDSDDGFPVTVVYLDDSYKIR